MKNEVNETIPYLMMRYQCGNKDELLEHIQSMRPPQADIVPADSKIDCPPAGTIIGNKGEDESSIDNIDNVDDKLYMKQNLDNQNIQKDADRKKQTSHSNQTVLDYSNQRNRDKKANTATKK